MNRKRFEVAEVPQSSFIDRLRNRVSREAVVVKLRNLLASKRLDDVTLEDIEDVLSEGHLTHATAKEELIALFEEAAHVVASVKGFSERDRRILASLQQAFLLSDDEAAETIERASCAMYESMMRTALADGVFTALEKEQVEDLAEGLRLSKPLELQIYSRVAQEAFEAESREIAAGGRVPVELDLHLDRLKNALGVEVSLPADLSRSLERGRQLARIEGGELPSLEVPIILTKGEVCHFTARGVSQHELRSVTKRINYSGPVASVRIMKGLRWRLGSVAIRRISQDVLTKIDEGDLYVTNKKILFHGTRKNTSIPLGKIVHFQAFSDGLQIDKQSGRDFMVTGEADWEIAGACIEVAATSTLT